jgi:hypothetical protein
VKDVGNVTPSSTAPNNRSDKFAIEALPQVKSAINESARGVLKSVRALKHAMNIITVPGYIHDTEIRYG